MKYYKRRYYDADCHILEFNPIEYRVDVTIGKHGILERLSQINGEPHEDEYVHAKVNGGFFSMNGSTEFIGSYVDNGLFYQGSDPKYPTAYFTKNFELKIDYSPALERHAWYQANAYWAIGCPWTLVVDGKENFTHSVEQLTTWYHHPKIRAPRTMFGQKADKTMVFVVVDGRSIWDKGHNLKHQADVMLKLGCVTALNLDGGGSSEMIVKDNIVNSPSDRRERRIGTAFMIYGKKDKEITPEKVAEESGNVKLPEFREFNRMGVVIRASTLNVRNKPGVIGSNVIGTLKLRDKVKIMAVDNKSGWYLIAWKEGGAWVSNNYIKLI